MNSTGGLLRSFYFLIFAGLGVFLPFYSVYLKDLGLSAWEISLLSISIPMVKIIMPPLYGIVADYWTGRRFLLRLFTVGSFLVWPFLYLAREFWPLLAVFSAYALFRGPVIAFANAATLSYLSDGSDSFGRIRLFGSLGFISAVLLSGQWADHFGISSILAPFGVLLLLTALLSFRINTGDEGMAFRARKGDLRALFRQRDLILLLLATVLIRTGEGGYNVFYSLYIVELGYSTGTAGALWGLGVISEVIILFVAGPRLRQWSLGPWLVLAGAANVLRWALLASWIHPGVLVIGQLLHGVTFGLFYLLAIESLQRSTNPRLKATVQSLFDMIGFGLAGVLGTLIAGLCWETGGYSLMYASSAVEAAVGTLVLLISLRLFSSVQHRPVAGTTH